MNYRLTVQGEFGFSGYKPETLNILAEENGEDVLAGRIYTTTLNLNKARREEGYPTLLSLMDDINQDMYEYYEDLQEAGIADDILFFSIIEQVQILERFRGSGLGLAATYDAIRYLRGATSSQTIFARIIVPQDLPNFSIDNEWDREMGYERFPKGDPASYEKLANHFGSLGFKPLVNDVLALKGSPRAPKTGHVRI